MVRARGGRWRLIVIVIYNEEDNGEVVLGIAGGGDRVVNGGSEVERTVVTDGRKEGTLEDAFDGRDDGLCVGSTEGSHMGLSLAEGGLDDGAQVVIGQVDGPIVAEGDAVSVHGDHGVKQCVRRGLAPALSRHSPRHRNLPSGAGTGVPRRTVGRLTLFRCHGDRGCVRVCFPR